MNNKLIHPAGAPHVVNGEAARNKNTAQSLAQLSSKTHKAKTNKAAQKATRGDMVWAGQ